MSVLERDNLQMHFLNYYIFNVVFLLYKSGYSIQTNTTQISASKLVTWAIRELYASRTPPALAEVVRKYKFASALGVQNACTTAPRDGGNGPETAQGAQTNKPRRLYGTQRAKHRQLRSRPVYGHSSSEA
jgi:hypothetical protein